jgi:2-polyprenyl-3-methyl-5-hydroxy-6-metoxy-1,4-benzoquinol methylase
MSALPFPEFDRVYQQAVRDVYAYWTPTMQARIAANNRTWEPGAFDFLNYLQASSVRFYAAYRTLLEFAPKRRVCDIGGFWGVLPITLRTLGFSVAMTESLRLYGDAFAPLFQAVAARGIAVVDYDPFQPGATLGQRFDAATAMAVIEHYPHSLEPFFENLIRLLEPRGVAYLEVPNIAYWPKRVALLLGTTPLVDARVIYRSAVPFVGHHHEYTMQELRGVAELAGLEVLHEEFFNYSLRGAGWRRTLHRPLESLAFAVAPSTRECMSITCRRAAAASANPGSSSPPPPGGGAA